MDDQVIKLLKRHLLQQNEMKIQNRHHYMDENFVFTSPRDIHWCKNCLQYDYNVFLRNYLAFIKAYAYMVQELKTSNND